VTVQHAELVLAKGRDGLAASSDRAPLRDALRVFERS
jgi:hypothetical protein